MYYDKNTAEKARAHFENTVIKGGIPDEIEEFAPSLTDGTSIPLFRLLTDASLTKSNGEARRMIQQNAVSIDGEKMNDPAEEIDISKRAPFVLKVGKRKYARIVGQE